MKLFIVFLLLSGAAQAAEEEVISLSRHFTLKTCDAEKHCVGPIAQNIEMSKVELKLTPFQKSTMKGLDGWDRNSLTEKGITFKSEIHLIKFAKPGKYKYYVYAMLRSGKRNGKIKKINFRELSDLKETIITDDPIKMKDATLQAQFVFGGD